MLSVPNDDATSGKRNERTQSNLRVQQADPSPGPGTRRSKGFQVWRIVLFEAQLLRRGPSGVDPPQVNRQSPAHRHDGLFLRGTGGLGVAQDRLPDRKSTRL